MGVGLIELVLEFVEVGVGVNVFVGVIVFDRDNEVVIVSDGESEYPLIILDKSLSQWE